MSSIMSRIDNLVMSKCVKGDCQFNHIINVSDVTACVKHLKSNKSDGNEGLSSNHIIYGSSSLFSTNYCTVYSNVASWIRCTQSTIGNYHSYC